MHYKDFEGAFCKPFIKAFHEFWSDFKAPATDTKVRYLEFGGGPSIINLVIACPNVDEIVFAEYTAANRQAVISWINGDPEAHDWTTLIELVVLEVEVNKTYHSVASLTDKDRLDAISSRASEVKRKIKCIVPCDVTKTPIIKVDSDDATEPFDVVATSFCLEVTVSSEEQYRNSVTELCKLLKPNGYLFMNGVLKETFYFVGEEKFFAFPLTENLVKEAMIGAGIEIEKFVIFPTASQNNCKYLYYVYGKKSA